MAPKITKKAKKKKTHFFTPPNILREKVGGGGLSLGVMERAQDFIESNELDFEPYARNILEYLDTLIVDAKSGTMTKKNAAAKLSGPVMELKANGGMFKYALVSEIAGVVLNFLENIDSLNDDSFNILDAHQATLYVIINNRLKGDGGKEGKILADELYGACRRYYKKYKIKVAG